MALQSKRSSLALLKNGCNEADTGSVVHEVTGHVKYGTQKVSGNVPSRNSMVSGNSGLKRGKQR